MNYEERRRQRELVERARAVRERLELGDGSETLTRADALELAELVEEVLRRTSPERFDRMMETIAQEAARRAGSMAATS